MSGEEIVSVVIGGTAYYGWKEVEIGWSYEKTEITFGLHVSEPDWSPTEVVPFLDQQVEIYAGSTLMVRGFIDNYEADAEVSDGSARHDVRIAGKSKGKDALESSAVHKTGRVEKKKLDEAANEIARESGVDVKYSADTPLQPIDKIQIQRGDTIFDVIEREARKIGVNLVGQPDGSVKITKPQGKRHAGQLVQGRHPLKSAGVSFDRSKQNSPIIAKGQKVLGTGKNALRITEKEFDETVGRWRPLILYYEGDGTKKKLKDRAKWHKQRQSGKGKKFRPTTHGWRDEGGQIWTPGHLVAIDAPLWHIQGDLMIQSVSFRQNHREGTVAELECVDPKAHGGKKAKGKVAKQYKAASK